MTTQYLNHPGLALGYRLEVGGAAVVYAVDHEPHTGQQMVEAVRSEPTPRLPLVHREERRHVEFLRGADVVIHDAQYTATEYPAKVGWGHTPVEWAVDYAVAAGARHLVLYHHDPLRDDAAVERLVEVCRARARMAGSPLLVTAAAEGAVIEVEEADNVGAMALGTGSEATPLLEGPPTVLVADDNPDILRLLGATLGPEGWNILLARDGETALRLARSRRPALVLADWQLPGLDGLAMCRALRAEPDPVLRDVPFVLLTTLSGEAPMAEGFAAGVSDYLVKPFTPAHVRSRARAWLLRHGAPRKAVQG